MPNLKEKYRCRYWESDCIDDFAGHDWPICCPYTRREVCLARIAYMDIQDVAWLTFMVMRNEKSNKKILTFAGPRAWTTQEVIMLCERLVGQDANVTTLPISVLRFTHQLTCFFQWTNDQSKKKVA